MLVVLLWVIGFLTPLLLAILVSWLKGTLSLVSPATRHSMVLAGEPNWWYATGILGVPFLLFITAFGLAHPKSPWARRFYGERKMARARSRYELEEAATVPSR